MRIKILKFITVLAVLCLIIFASALDSESSIPLVICLVSSVWLLLIAYANTPKEGGYGA